MLNPKTHHPPANCQQRDVDICAALMGKPLGKTKLEDIQIEPQQLTDAPSPLAVDLTQLLVLPTNKTAMKAWVRQVQSQVVQVSENVKVRMAGAGDQVKSRMSVVSDQMKARMADSAVQAAKRMRKAG